MGFEYTEGGSDPAKIARVTIISPDMVDIETNKVPTDQNARLRYAYSGVIGSKPGADVEGSVRGNLRDTDPTPSYYHHNLYNWAVQFDLPVGWKAPFSAGQMNFQVVKNVCNNNGATDVELQWNDFSNLANYNYTLSRKDAPDGQFQGMGGTKNRYFANKLIPDRNFVFKLGIESGNQLVGTAFVNMKTTACSQTSPSPSPSPSISPSPSPSPSPSLAPPPAPAFSLNRPVTSCVSTNSPKVHLEWTQVPNLQGEYQIYFRQQGIDKEIRVGSTAGTTFDINTSQGLISGQSYGFIVAAITPSGTIYSNGKWSDRDDVYGWTSIPACP